MPATPSNAMLESQRHSDTNVSTARLAGERLNRVLQDIGEIDEINLPMATATEKQTSVVDNLDRDINHINELNQKTFGNLHSTLQACNKLENQSIRLNKWSVLSRSERDSGPVRRAG